MLLLHVWFWSINFLLHFLLSLDAESRRNVKVGGAITTDDGLDSDQLKAECLTQQKVRNAANALFAGATSCVFASSLSPASSEKRKSVGKVLFSGGC